MVTLKGRLEDPAGTAERSVHADLDALPFRRRSVEAHFDLIQVDVDDLFAVGAHFRHLPVEIDRISATGAARNDNTNDLCFLLHDMQSFRKWSKCGYFVTLGGR